MHKDKDINKENYKDLVLEYINKDIMPMDTLPEVENPSMGLSQEGLLLVIMVTISQQLTRSWYYKMKNQSFNKYFTKVMSKYSYSLWLKLFENKNFRVVIHKFLSGDGFREAFADSKSMQDNAAAYEDAVQEFLSKCEA